MTLSLDALDDATLVLLSQGEFRTDSRLVLHRDGWTDSLVKLRRVLLEPG